MKETVSDNVFTPEDKEELKKAFALGMLFAEKSPEEFIEILKSREKENKE